MDAATAKLTEASSSLAKKLYAEQTADASKGDAAPEDAPADDGVVEAEFEEVKDDK